IRDDLVTGVQTVLFRSGTRWSLSGQGHCSAEGLVRVVQFLLRGGNVEDERPIPYADVARQLVADPLVAAHEVGAHGLVVLEGHEPVRTVARGRRVGQVR